jgi:hypothetical protein
MTGMIRGRLHQAYVCSERFRNGGCFPNTVWQGRLLEVVKEIVKANLFAGADWSALKAAIVRRVKERPECRAEDARHLRQELEKAKGQLDRAAQNLLSADAENLPILDKAMTELRLKVRALEAQLAPAKKPEDAEAIAEEIIANAKQLCSQLFEAEGDRLKAVLSEVVKRIEFRFEWGLSHGRKRRVVAKGDIYLRTDWSRLTRDGRGECPKFEPDLSVLRPFVDAFLRADASHLDTLSRLMIPA